MIILVTAFYAVSYALSMSGHYYLSGLILIIAALALYIKDYIRTGNIINLRALFSLSFVGGTGVSCLKLSYLQTDWETETWICLWLAFAGFYLCYEILLRTVKKEVKPIKYRIGNNKLSTAIVILTLVSVISFCIEAATLKYIPLFVRGVPHAYSEFHLPGLHYFTVSCVLIPSLSVMWMDSFNDKKRLPVIIICALIGFIIPVLCVSRFQFAFALVLALFTYIALIRKTPWKLIIACFIVAVPVYLILSVARSHNVEYLNSIFEMKYDFPIWISHPYIYIANNYDNFNALVRDLPEHTYGLRVLYPLFTLTGLKFKYPQLVTYPIYVTKTELTTLTLFYDLYYDFGAIGVLLGSALLGAFAFALDKLVKERYDKAASFIYAQFCVYMTLSFFTTWFSNPATWFYLGVSVIIYVCILDWKSGNSSSS